MWMFIKVIIVVTAFIWQFVIIYGAEAIAEETGNYDQAIYEMLWFIMLFFIGGSLIKENDK